MKIFPRLLQKQDLNPILNLWENCMGEDYNNKDKLLKAQRGNQKLKEKRLQTEYIFEEHPELFLGESFSIGLVATVPAVDGFDEIPQELVNEDGEVICGFSIGQVYPNEVISEEYKFFKECDETVLENKMSEQVSTAEKGESDNVLEIDYTDISKLSIPVKKNELCVLIDTICVAKFARNEGIASLLSELMLKIVKKEVTTKDYFVFALSWLREDAVDSHLLLESLGFNLVAKINRYWYEETLIQGSNCIDCGNPCLCTGALYVKNYN